MSEADKLKRVEAIALREAHITINGTRLTPAQSMTFRVALESFASGLQAGLGNDEHGRAMTRLYRERIKEIRKSLYGN